MVYKIKIRAGNKTYFKLSEVPVYDYMVQQFINEIRKKRIKIYSANVLTNSGEFVENFNKLLNK